MRRIYAYNIFCNFVDFLKANRAKFIVTVALLVCGIIFGIVSGASVTDVNNYLFTHNSNTFVLIIGGKSALGYFFWRFLILSLIAIVIVLLSFNFYLAMVGYMFLFFYAFIFTMYLTLYIILFQVAVLPLIFLCLAPCMIVIYFILSVFVVMSFNRGREIKCYGCNNKIFFITYIKSCIPIYVCLICIILIEAILAFFFTLGIAI